MEKQGESDNSVLFPAPFRRFSRRPCRAPAARLDARYPLAWDFVVAPVPKCEGPGARGLESCSSKTSSGNRNYGKSEAGEPLQHELRQGITAASGIPAVN